MAGYAEEMRRDAEGSGRNVHDAERLASAIGGGALALYGLRRRDAGGVVLALLGGLLVQRGVTGRCPVYRALDVNTARAPRGDGLEKQHGPAAVLDASHAVKVEHAVTVDLPAADLFAWWRDFENLPRMMHHLERVDVLDDQRSRWRVKAPAGQTVEWEAVIHHEIPGRLIAWKSAEGALVPNAGSVHFDPSLDGRGTVVKVVLEYQPPGGQLGRLVAKVFGEEPDLQVRDDLRRFKARMEAGAGGRPGAGAGAR